MRNHKSPKRCTKTSKVSFSSEARAVRALNKYKDITRTYYCSHCDGFHLTSQGIEEVLENGELELAEENKLLRKKVDRMDNTIIQVKTRNSELKNEIEKFELFINLHPEIADYIKEGFVTYKNE